MSDDLRASVRALEVTAAAARARVDEARAAVERARARRAWLLELLEVDEAGAPLPLFPLVGAIVSALGSLAAALGVYAVSMGGKAPWTLLAIAGLGCTFFGLLAAKRPGAGGSARALLTRFSSIVGVLSLVTVFIAILVAH